MENVSDPAHIPVSHHGLMGSRYADAKYYDMIRVRKGLAFFGLPMPIWLGHILASLFLHQDLVFLHYQEKNIAQQKKGKWMESVYTPNPQDKMVITFRKWLKNINRLIWLTWIGAIASLCLGLLMDARIVAAKGFSPLPTASFWWGLGIGILLAIAGYFLKKLSRLFYIYEFEHAHNN